VAVHVKMASPRLWRVKPATASVVADALKAKGLTTRAARPQNRRTIALSLTEDAAAKAAQVDDSLGGLETMDIPLTEADAYAECPDFVPVKEEIQ
jgi:DNA-binding MarR family transcriptional regulator